MLLLASAALAFDSEPVDVLLRDEAELFTNVEFSTGPLPAGSPLAVELRIEANGGAGVEMEGEGSLWWPEALTIGFTGEPGSGIYLLDASLDAVAEVQVDLSDFGYTGTFEIDRRSLSMDGATFFDPFVLGGAEQDRVEVVDTAAGTEIIDFSQDIFLGVTLTFSADVTPTFTAGLEGVQWAVNEGTIQAEGAPAALTPARTPDLLVDATYTAQWDARFDLVFTPVFGACFPIYGCVDIARFDIPLEIAADTFLQDFPSATYAFPLPLIEPGLDEGAFGDVATGSLANLEVPIGNGGNLAVYGEARIEGDGEFSVYPTQFNALPGTTDGLVVTFSPTAAGAQAANLVLTSNDPSIPTLTIPLSGNGLGPADDGSEDLVGEDEVRTEEVDGCGCATPGAPLPALAVVAAAGLLARRRRA